MQVQVIEEEGEHEFYFLSKGEQVEVGILLDRSLICEELGGIIAHQCEDIEFRKNLDIEDKFHHAFSKTLPSDSVIERKKAKEELSATIADFSKEYGGL